MFFVPLWTLAVPPLVAFVAVLAYLTAPRLRRDAALRGILIASVAVTAAEVLAAAIILGLLIWFSMSGGMDEF